MINFFRNIRRQLAADNKPLKYMRYAIGEILLVVIGILIALQIDTWQKNQESRIQERKLLIGLKADIIADTLQITNRFKPSNADFDRNVLLFDSLRNVENEKLDVKYVDSIFARCVRQRNTFFPIAGTYKTIISNGLSGKLRNQKLFKLIQELYEKQYVSIEKSGDRMDALSDKIRFLNRNIMFLPERERLSYYKGKASKSDIELWRSRVDNFESALDRVIEGDIKKILPLIEEELEGN